MQENNVSLNTISKQNTLISEKTQTVNLNENQNNTSSQVNIYTLHILIIYKCHILSISY